MRAAPATTTRLVLIRHGQSQVQLDGIVGGTKGCRGLSELGVRQAEALRDRLARTGELAGAHALLASGLPRARETAEIIAPAFDRLDVVIDDDLRELDPGEEADGISWADFERRYRGEGFVWSPYEPMAPGAESWAVFQERVARALHRISHEHAGRTVVLACHGGIVDGSMIAFLGLPFLGTSTELQSTNAGITEWQLARRDDSASPRHPPRWTLTRYNDHAHLADLD
ncbi:histidine phosphatase family protein [soil metagenome]